MEDDVEDKKRFTKERNVNLNISAGHCRRDR
jgi:hypothetical protein